MSGLALVTKLLLLAVPLAGYLRERPRRQTDEGSRLVRRRDPTAGSSRELG
jgi:hypothetical protein